MKGGFVYMMTSRPNGTLYLGVTNDLARRAWEHREGTAPGFTRQYGQREKTMKHWSRAWKVRMILDLNPQWRDLYEDLNL